MIEPMKTCVLVVEDDRRIAEVVAKNLEAAGYSCRLVHDGSRVPEIVEETAPALILLDLMLPGLDGFEITRRIRMRTDVPIVLLTAREAESDKVLGFELGADDYVTKPFSPRELVARVRALLRRSGAADARPVERGDLVVDPTRREIRLGGERVEVTTLEFDLLHFLAARPGAVFSREALLEHVWGRDRVVDERSIDSLVSRLRKKIEPDPARPTRIVTVWGAGYRFSEDA
jgi:DNA-binding response OmpR family regulator